MPDAVASHEIVGPIDFREQRVAERATAQLIGTPDHIIEKVIAMQEAVSNDTLVLEFLPQGLPHAEAVASLELFAREVLPTMQAIQTPLHRASLGSAADDPGARSDDAFHISEVTDEPPGGCR